MGSSKLIKLFKSHFWILLHIGMIIGPMVAFSAILLGLVYLNIWDKRPDRPNDLSLSSGFLSDTLYVDYSATSLILVASWSSSAAIPLIGSLLALISYPVAAHMLLASNRSMETLLPTPGQLGLLVELLDGRKSSLWTWLSGLWRKSTSKVTTLWIIELPVGIQLIGIVLSIAIVATDTWLHIATSSTTMWYLAKVTPEDYAFDRAYSRQLRDDCFDTADNMPCSIRLGQDNTNRTQFAPAVKDLIVRQYDNTQVNRSTGGFFLAPTMPGQGRSIDKNSIAFQTFTASTEYVEVVCDQNLTNWCTIDTSADISKGWRYNCTAGMTGNLTTESKIRVGSWYHPNSDQDPYNDMWAYYNNGTAFRSKVEFGLVAFLQDVKILNTPNINGDGDNKTIVPYIDGATSGTFIATRCNVTFSKGEYDWSNVTTLPKMVNNDTSLSAIIAVRSRLFAGYFDGQDFDRDQATSLLDKFPHRGNTTHIDDTNQGVVNAIGSISMGLLGGTFESAPAKYLSIGNSTIVTEIRKAPLFILVMLNLWYAAFAACLGTLVIYIVRDDSFRQDILEVQKLLTVDGLATSTMGRHEEQLEDVNSRVCVQKINGKWRFRCLTPGNMAGQSKKLMDSETFVD